MKEKTYRTARGTVHYWIEQNNNSHVPVMVLLHGLTADHTLFERQVSYFQENWTLLLWDAPAHGKSRPYQDFSYTNLADDLKGILDAEKISRAVMVGQSMGGFVIQAFLLKFPEMVQAFVGIDTCPFGRKYYSRSDLWWLRQVGWMAHLYPASLLLSGLAKRTSVTPYGMQNMQKALSCYSKAELCSLLGTGFSSFVSANADLKIPCPVLLLVGDQDKTGHVKRYCTQWNYEEGYRLCIIAHAGHNANIDNDKAVNAEIEHFLQSIL